MTLCNVGTAPLVPEIPKLKLINCPGATQASVFAVVQVLEVLKPVRVVPEFVASVSVCPVDMSVTTT